MDACHFSVEESMNLNSLLLKLRGCIDAKQWYQFGVAIGVPKDVLDLLKGYDEEQCMIELADYWLKNHPAKPTWSEISNTAKKFKKQESAKFNEYMEIQDIMAGIKFNINTHQPINLIWQHMYTRISKAISKCLPT